MIKQINGLNINLRDGVQDEYVYDEIFKRNFFKKFPLKSDDTILELGGHIGLFALFACKSVKEIVSFEPDADNIELYNKNMNNNNIKNCTVMSYAVVGNNDTERMLYSRKGNNSIHNLYSTYAREGTNIKCMNINEALKLRKFNKMKMDIEGAEYEVIKNIQNFDGIESMIIEYHFNVLKDYVLEKYMEILEILRKNFTYVDYLPLGSRNLSTIMIVCNKYINVTEKKKSLFE